MVHNQALEKIQSIHNLPPLPTIALEVNRLLQDTETAIDQLVELIEKDQALAMKLLKLVNSSFYGFKKQVNNLRHAVTLMGYNTIQNAVVTISVMEAFKFDNDLKNFKIDHFWQHAIRVAVMSRFLAAKTRLVPGEAAFTAGLIHDIGKVVQVNFFSRELVAVLQTMQKENISYCLAEHRLAICSHTIIGSHLARHWMLPESIVEAIRDHHQSGSGAGDNEALISMVGFANNLVHMMDEDQGYHLHMEQGHEEIKNLIVDALRDGNQWFTDIKKEMEDACSFFNKG